MSNKYDVIVVGSGFGGAVAACRLAESGAKVLILERGRRWTKEQYPRKPTDAWFYKHTDPHKFNGWLDLRFFKGMTVALGAGVGGGSLCYSSVIMEADSEHFENGNWPKEINYTELKPYYNIVRTMLNVREIPSRQHTHRYQLMQKAADQLGYRSRFSSVPLAITFDEKYSYDLPNPLDYQHSKTIVNSQGKKQGTCIHLGNCDIGCDVHAKNTLDLNYLALAEKYGAEIRPLHIVYYVKPTQEGYQVIFDRIENGKLWSGMECAEKIILAAGSLGSTEILLRSKNEYQTLPNISDQLGQRWSANANFLTPDKYPDTVQVNQGIGPTISAGLNFMDGKYNGQRFFIEDDGFPNIYLNTLTSALRPSFINPNNMLGRFIQQISAQIFNSSLRRGLSEKNPTDRIMVWLGEGIDASDGQLMLERSLLKPWRKEIKLHWNSAQSKAVIDTIVEMHQKLSNATGGNIQIPLFWSLLNSLVTVHPLGGSKIGNTPGNGVVDHLGEVFGYKNLYVMDGSILPGAIGRNPSMTIAALAERSTCAIIKKQ